MEKSDIICPGCDEAIYLRNALHLEKDQVEVLGIVYALRCKNCDTVFCTKLRQTQQLSDEDANQLGEMMKDWGGKHEQ